VIHACGASSFVVIAVNAPTTPGTYTEIATVAEANVDTRPSNNSVGVTVQARCGRDRAGPLTSAERQPKGAHARLSRAGRGLCTTREPAAGRWLPALPRPEVLARAQASP
jgi:hypothetical protein